MSHSNLFKPTKLMLIKPLNIFVVFITCLLFISTKVEGQSSIAKIDDFMKNFQRNIKGMEGMKNTFFISEYAELTLINNENIGKVKDYINTSYFKKLNFSHKAGEFISCKKGDYKFYYVYAYESTYNKSVTFELTSDFKIKTIVTQKYVKMLTACTNDGGDTPPKSTNSTTNPSPTNTEQPTQPLPSIPNSPYPSSAPSTNNKVVPCPPCKVSDALFKENEVEKSKNDSLVRENRYKQDSIFKLNINLTDTAKLLTALEKKYNALNFLYLQQYDCIHSFCDSIQAQLAEANEYYAFYKRHQENVKLKNSKESKEHFRKAWEIYRQIYASNTQNPICLLTKKDCLGKNPEACLNIANTLIRNNGQVVDELGSTLNQKLNTRTEMILFSLSLIIKDSANEYRPQAIELLAYLPRILFQEKTNTNRGTLALLNEVKVDYENGDFSSSLSKFDKIYYLLDLEEFKQLKQSVLDAKFCVGMILLWQLTDNETVKPWLIPGSWLYGFEHKGAQMGRELLREVEKKTVDTKVINQIKYALSKYPD